MKKQLIIISIIVVIVSIFASCSVNSSNENISTTAVTDNHGIARYYEPVTDDKGNILTTDKNQRIFAEIETQSNGKAVTTKDGTYVTNEHTTVLPNNNTTDNTSITRFATENSSYTTEDATDVDNDIPFETSTEKKSQSKTTTILNTTISNDNTDRNENQTSNTESPTKVVTDKDGWIDKWY